MFGQRLGSRTSAAIVPPPSKQPNFLLVKIGSHEFAIASDVVRQLMPHPEWMQLPDCPEWCAGLLSFADVAVPVLNTHRILNMREPAKPGAAVVVEPGVASEFPWFALAVDRLTVTTPIRNHELTPVRATSTLPFREYVTSAWRGRSRPCYLLNLPALIPADELHRLPALLRSTL